METPSSTRRVTRSQTLGASTNNSNLLLSRKVEESEKTMTKSRKKSGQMQHHDRSALFDITNDSPIVGLATGNLRTPSSAMTKMRGQFTRTPGSGEALLRGQVKTLLQKVEEEAELSKIETGTLFNYPFNLAAPTPANTPQILTLSANLADACLPPSLTPTRVDDKFFCPQMMVSEMLDEEKLASDNMITRSLMLEFSEKSSDSSKCSSVLSYQGALCCGDTEGSQEKVLNTADDDDASSVWSMQVNASSTRDDQEEECDGDCYYYDYEEEEEENDFGDKSYDDGALVDELCEGISNISVQEGLGFVGKHIRFVYNSDDDEIKGEERVSECVSSPPSCGRGVLRLRGLPTPRGKHVRFPQE